MALTPDNVVFLGLYFGFTSFNWNIAQRREAFRLDKVTTDTDWTAWFKILTSFLVIAIAPVVFFWCAYPIVSFYGSSESGVWTVARHLVLTLYWVTVPFGCQQSWYLLAQPRNWTPNAPEVLGGNRWIWWFFLGAFVVGPVVSLALAWAGPLR